MQDLIDKENARVAARAKRQEEIFTARDAAITTAQDEASKAMLALWDEDAKAVSDLTAAMQKRREQDAKNEGKALPVQVRKP